MSLEWFDHLRAAHTARIKQDRQIFFVTHNTNHIRMFADTEHLLRQLGYRTMFCVPLLFHRSGLAVAELQRRGHIAHPLDRMIETARRGDVVIVGLDEGPKKLRMAIKQLGRRGILTVGMIEGARFPKLSAFRNVRTVFVWGRSGVRAYGARAKEVGSVVIEDMMRRTSEPIAARRAVVNYKFTHDDSKLDSDHIWLRSAIRVCKEHGFEPILSCHPAEQHEISGLTWSDRPIEDLITESALVVSRSSTVIYQALATGVQPFLFPIAKEKLLELSKPMGSFPICKTAEELSEAMSQWCSDGMPKPDTRFLDRHVSVRPGDPATQRVAEAILRLAHGWFGTLIRPPYEIEPPDNAP